MADGYIENKMEEYRARVSSHAPKRTWSLSKLLYKNRSYRGYDSTFKVRAEQLRKIIAVNTLLPSARNQQVLRFRPILSNEAHKVLPHIRLGGALPELNLPLVGTEPNAFVIVCSTEHESRYVDIDLGISAQSMLLQAVEMGLNGICIGAFDKKEIISTFNLKYDPLLILAFGRGVENIELIDIRSDEDHNYYRKDGKHYVPKVGIEDIII